MTNHAETTMTEQAVAVVVYSKPKCVQCTATYRKLDKHHINYTVVDITQDPDAYEFVKALGYQQAPVTFVALPDGQSAHWSGYIPDLIKQHITERKDAA
ncbi:glutaredoxin family protein [Arthrobacter woluwensis]|uniref:glutaredoxin family protein n=1 Tax=Arthrobacter woluwensis TaxID=156980 RepID=UPI0021BDE763|nr:glutaredoxin family protein [Arthrobacter woluwensis]